ncbi:sensor histidine kinase [Sphingomonas flavalba]|uniref:sensor histidine kinase n=1 Tax=Sphingomonas flavalba TaxID=2559804 RepID=UPI0039DF87EF
MSGPAPAPPDGILDRLGRLSTAAKMLGLLSIALLPLGLIILLASLQTSRTADLERRAVLRVALSESTRRVASEIAFDIEALRAATAALDAGSSADSACARTRAIIHTAAGDLAGFVLVDPAGNPICGTPGVAPPARGTGPLGPPATLTLDGNVLRISLSGAIGGHAGAVALTTTQLARLARPLDFQLPYRLEISDSRHVAVLADIAHLPPLARTEEVTNRIRDTNLSLTMQVRAIPLTPPQLLTMLVPLLMWAAASLIGWLVVDRLVLRPLAELRAAIESYQPGEPFGEGRKLVTPAREIRALGDTFRTITESLAAHETELALGLREQTRLTREVHHRVKNNLQIIASLINLHARGAKSAETVAAYASIQRRVDALAVVHRNHYAELENSRGVALRPLVGEIAASLRATAPTGAGAELSVEAAADHVTQDVAVALAFLITELVELAMLTDPAAAIRITVTPADTPAQSRLTVTSTALTDSRRLRDRLDERYGRVLEGLARQLRAPLHVDPLNFSYSIVFARVSGG